MIGDGDSTIQGVELRHFLRQTLRRQIFKRVPRGELLIGRPLCLLSEVQTGGGDLRSRSHRVCGRGSQGREREMSPVVYLSFIPSPPSHLLILRLQVRRVGQEGIPNERVSIVTGHQTGAAVLSSLVGCRPPIS